MARRKLQKHGLSYTPEYSIWTDMIRRCHDPRVKEFGYYGARGISVCQRWRDSLVNFVADVGARPNRRHSLDRINNDGNYEPGNVRWATMAEQVRNSRRGIWLTAESGERVCVRQVAERHGITDDAVYKRMGAGWSDADVIALPRGSRPADERQKHE